jgi:hypothetical protein
MQLSTNRFIAIMRLNVLIVINYSTFVLEGWCVEKG